MRWEGRKPRAIAMRWKLTEGRKPRAIVTQMRHWKKGRKSHAIARIQSMRWEGRKPRAIAMRWKLAEDRKSHAKT